MPSRRVTLVVVLAFALVVLGASAVAAPQQAGHRLHSFHGTVTKAAPAHHWLRIRTTGNRLIRFHTGHATQWHGCNWRELHRGHAVTVRAYRSGGSWIAIRISDRHHARHG